MLDAVWEIRPVNPPSNTPPEATGANAEENPAGIALVRAGNVPAPRVLKLFKVPEPSTPEAEDTMLENCPVIGNALKLPSVLVRAGLTPRLDPNPAIDPAPGNMPAPAMLITALSGPPQDISAAYDHVRTSAGY